MISQFYQIFYWISKNKEVLYKNLRAKNKCFRYLLAVLLRYRPKVKVMTVDLIETSQSFHPLITAHKMKFSIKGALSGLRQFLATKSPLKMMKNAFCFTSKALFVLKVFKFLSWLFGHAAEQLDKKGKVNFKSYDVTGCLTNNCNIHIVQSRELKAIRQ